MAHFMVYISDDDFSVSPDRIDRILKAVAQNEDYDNMGDIIDIFSCIGIGTNIDDDGNLVICGTHVSAHDIDVDLAKVVAKELTDKDDPDGKTHYIVWSDVDSTSSWRWEFRSGDIFAYTSKRVWESRGNDIDLF